jgi:peptide/nickel transport system permease protein
LTLGAAVFAPWITPEDPNEMHLPLRYEAPSFSHPFGRDENGGDVFTKVVYGARISLAVSLGVVGAGAALGLLLGSLSGFFGGAVDSWLMRLTDMFYAFPNFLLALGVIALLGPSLMHLIFAMSLTSWTSFARLVRGEVLHLKEREHVLGAKALGAGPLRLLVIHIWPHLVGLLLVQSTFALASVIIAVSGLSFLGLGVPASVPSWGALLSSGRRILFEAPHVSLFPGLAILFLVLGFHLLGEGLRSRLSLRHSPH